MRELIWKRLTDIGDPDIPVIRSTLLKERYISIDGDRYFDYVTGTDGVYFHKICAVGDGQIAPDTLLAVLHTEICGDVLSTMIFVFPEYRRLGIGRQITTEFCRNVGDYSCTVIEAAIESENIQSMALFEGCGFRHAKTEDELEILVYSAG